MKGSNAKTAKDLYIGAHRLQIHGGSNLGMIPIGSARSYYRSFSYGKTA